jgi:CubicO group peptidase (beta-lactamase class C family)
MSKIRNRFVASVLLVLVLAGSVAAQQLQRAIPEEVGLSSARLERISTVLTQYVEEEQLPGVVALVARRGRVAYLEAFGHRDREAGAPQQVDDIFRIASQTKAIVSVAIMMLQEEGRLLISHPLGRYLPEFSETTVAVAHGDGDGGYDVVPARRAITIRDLLTHTSGIGYGGGPASERWASRSSRASRSTSADRSSGSTLMATRVPCCSGWSRTP